jgi:hypothetical protein
MEEFLKEQIIDPIVTPLKLVNQEGFPSGKQAILTTSSTLTVVKKSAENESQAVNNKKILENKKKSLESAITYFRNNNTKSRMKYAESVALNHVIGSGVTEAACKTIVKQRLCKSGMRWKDKGAAIILSLRTLVHSTGRWEQFWKKVNQYGFPIAA